MKLNKNLKILFLDIETMPNVGAFWQAGYELNIGPEAIMQERFILSVQWSWNNDKIVHGLGANIKKRDDSNIVKAITKEIRKADVVVGHNVRKFDLRWIAGRALLLGLEPTHSKFVPHLDTMVLAKQTFYLNSYKMDYICKKLGIPGKVKTSFSDWMAILNVDVDSKLAQKRADYLLKYGKHDINMNRKLFYKLLPHCKFTKPMRQVLFGTNEPCPECRSNAVQKWAKRSTRAGVIFQRYRCMACCHTFQVEE